jgi:CRP-like cAMP-binding protein
MDKYSAMLLNTPLFRGMTQKDMISMMQCLSVRSKKYAQNQVVYLSGDKIDRIGIILQGKVIIIKEDYNNNRSIIAEFREGDIFGEAFSFSSTDKLTVSVISASDSEILFIDPQKIFSFCSSACTFHSKLIENMLFIISNKNILLNEKIDVLSKRTIKNRLLAFLQIQSQKFGKTRFSIQFNRQELADYLCVDRSALSNELSKLQDEGLLSFSHNEFQLDLVSQKGLIK